MIETLRRHWPVFLFLGVLAVPAPAAAASPYTIGYLAIEDDPRHEERRSYANIVIRPAIQPFEGAKAGLRAGRIIGRSLKVEFRLTRVEGRSAGDLAAGLVLHGSRRRYARSAWPRRLAMPLSCASP